MPGLTVLFQTAAQNKRRNAESLISYQNMRGGEVRLFAIPVSIPLIFHPILLNEKLYVVPNDLVACLDGRVV